jgi:hypothetical protein
MHLFSRTVQLVGPPSEVGAFVSEIRAHVSKRLDQDVGVWSVGFSQPVGTMVFTARVDGIAGVMAMQETFANDAEYEAILAKGAGFRAGPAIDGLSEPILGDMDGDPPPVGTVVAVTSAQIANGKYADAFAWGVEVAQHVQQVSGVEVAFLRDVFGPFGSVRWISGYPDGAAADAANAAVNGDEGYMKLLGDSADLFIQGSGHQGMGVRIA